MSKLIYKFFPFCDSLRSITETVCYTITLYDGYVDGWNNNTLSFNTTEGDEVVLTVDGTQKTMLGEEFDIVCTAAECEGQDCLACLSYTYTDVSGFPCGKNLMGTAGGGPWTNETSWSIEQFGFNATYSNSTNSADTNFTTSHCPS